MHDLPLDDRHSLHHTARTLADPPLSCVDWEQLQPMSWSRESGLPRQLRNITQIITANLTFVTTHSCAGFYLINANSILTDKTKIRQTISRHKHASSLLNAAFTSTEIKRSFGWLRLLPPLSIHVVFTRWQHSIGQHSSAHTTHSYIFLKRKQTTENQIIIKQRKIQELTPVNCDLQSTCALFAP